MGLLEFPRLSKNLSLDDFCLSVADEIRWCIAKKLSHDSLINSGNKNGKYHGVIIYNCKDYEFMRQVSSKLRLYMEKTDINLPILLLPDTKELPMILDSKHYPFNLQWFIDNDFVKYGS